MTNPMKRRIIVGPVLSADNPATRRSKTRRMKPFWVFGTAIVPGANLPAA